MGWADVYYGLKINMIGIHSHVLRLSDILLPVPIQVDWIWTVRNQLTQQEKYDGG